MDDGYYPFPSFAKERSRVGGSKRARYIRNGYSQIIKFPRCTCRRFDQSWISTLKRAQIPYFPIYNCRHTAASRMAGAGIPDVIIRQLIGHTANSNVLLTYARAVDEVRREAIRRLEEHRESSPGWASNRSIQ